MITKDHIKNIVDSIDCTIVVTSVEVVDSTNYKLFTANKKWATFGKLLSGLKIVVVGADYIQVETVVAPIVGTFTLANPFFYFGTFLDTNMELVKEKASNNKLPFIYLHLNAPETYAGNLEMLDFSSDCAIYFMVDCDPKNWLTGDHIENAIKPMRSLLNEFIKQTKAYPKLNTPYEVSYTVNDYANFGEVQNNLGVVKKIFSDNISGSELLIKVGFNKCVNCQCN